MPSSTVVENSAFMFPRMYAFHTTYTSNTGASGVLYSVYSRTSFFAFSVNSVFPMSFCSSFL